ncbi:hypothetical protein [Ferrimonas pelagia]|uniref:Uncharacterized protein n=1 Tax=Ferrimonas pelagia TaxID=1177826 RepID=A0ABP9FD60_9GAMM
MERLLFSTLLLSVAAAPTLAVDASPYPQVRLQNEQLRLQVHLPDPERGAYRATRFDHAGLIHSLRYQGVEYFGPWQDGPHDPYAHGAVNGPVESFSPLGLEEGASYVKIGIGVIAHPEGPYRFRDTHEILDAGDWQVRQGEDWITMEQSVQQPRFASKEGSYSGGFGYRYRKTVRLTEQGFVLERQLENTGLRGMDTEMFNHNFFALASTELGTAWVDAQYQLQLAFEPQVEKAEPRLALEGKQVQLLQAISNEQRLFVPLAGHAGVADHQFTVHHTGLNRGISVQGSLPLSKLVLWANDKAISPENFVRIQLAAGESLSWHNEYRVY